MQHRRTTELFLLPLFPGTHESSCGHFIAARYNFDSAAPITVWDSLSGDSTSQSGEEFLSDTYNALCTALASEREDTSYTTHATPQFNRERRSRLPLQTEGLDCAFFAACCNGGTRYKEIRPVRPKVCAYFGAQWVAGMSWRGRKMNLLCEVINEHEQPRVAASRSNVRSGNIQPDLHPGVRRYGTLFRSHNRIV